MNWTKHIYLIIIVAKLCSICRNVHEYSQLSLDFFLFSFDNIFLTKNVQESRRQSWQIHINFSIGNWIHSRDAPRFMGFQKQGHSVPHSRMNVDSCFFWYNSGGFLLWLAIFHNWQNPADHRCLQRVISWKTYRPKFHWHLSSSRIFLFLKKLTTETLG